MSGESAGVLIVTYCLLVPLAALIGATKGFLRLVTTPTRLRKVSK